MAIPNDLRQINRRRLLLAAMRMGTASRSELARATGLSQPTAGKIVDELVDDHVLSPAPTAPSSNPKDEPAQVAGRLGRPGTSLTLDGTTPQFLGSYSSG
jgi:hypothetical protein